jgi:hypothetical protein
MQRSAAHVATAKLNDENQREKRPQQSDGDKLPNILR